jgi:hypothetical protein
MIVERLFGVLSSLMARITRKVGPHQEGGPTPVMEMVPGVDPVRTPKRPGAAEVLKCRTCGGPLPPTRPPRVKQGFCSAKCYAKEFRRRHPTYYARYQKMKRADPDHMEGLLGYSREYRRNYIVQQREWGPTVDCPRCRERGKVMFVSYMNIRTGKAGPERIVIRHHPMKDGRRAVHLHCLSKSRYPDLYIQMGLSPNDLRKRVLGEANALTAQLLARPANG